MLLVLVDLRTNLTTGALAALLGTSQSAVDPIIHHLVPVLARSLRPAPDNSDPPVDHRRHPDPGARPVDHRHQHELPPQRQHPDHHRAHARRVVAVRRCWPANRNDVVVTRATVAHLLTGHEILGDRGYRAINTVTTPHRDHTGPIIRDEHYRAHRRVRARVEHVLARLKDSQILRQCRRRAKPSTTAPKSSPDFGTSRHTNNYGSTLSERQHRNMSDGRCGRIRRLAHRAVRPR